MSASALARRQSRLLMYFRTSTSSCFALIPCMWFCLLTAADADADEQAANDRVVVQDCTTLDVLAWLCLHGPEDRPLPCGRPLPPAQREAHAQSLGACQRLPRAAKVNDQAIQPATWRGYDSFPRSRQLTRSVRARPMVKPHHNQKIRGRWPCGFGRHLSYCLAAA